MPVAPLLWMRYCISLVTSPSVSCQNNAKNLDPPYKMDLDFWDCLGRVKFGSEQSFIFCYLRAF